MRKLIALLLVCSVAFAGGAIDFDGDDYYTCGTIDFSASGDDDASFVAWVTPDFASSDTSTKVIFSSVDINTCPTLPPFCMGVTCGEGHALYWDGANTRFVALQAEFERCGTGINTFTGCSMASVSFSAGDLIGIYVTYRDGVQGCQTLIPAGTGSSGSGSFNHVILADTNPTLVGAAPASHTGSSIGLHWEGSIDMLIMGEGRVINIDANRLEQQHKRSWYPMFTGTHALNGDGGTDPFDYTFSADMMQGNVGDTVSTLRPQVGSTCSSSGDPSATLTRMMY